MPLSRIQTTLFSGDTSDSVLRSLLAPPAPTGLTVTGGNAQASLSWVAPTVLSQTPITDYIVQYSSNSGSTWTTFSDGVSTSVSTAVTGLSNGTSYTFRIAAVNGIGQGSYSSSSAAVTPATGPFEGISGMFGWWDSSDTTTLYSNTAGTTLATSGDVLRWNDKSVNGNHAVVPNGWNSYTKPQITASAKNSLTALLFNAYGAGFSIGDKLPLVTTGATIFAALQRDDLGGNPTFIAKGEEGTYYGWGITSDFAFWRTSAYAQTSVSSSNAWAVMAITIPAGNWPATSIFLNGSAAAQSLYNQGISAPPSTAADLTIGRNGSSGEGWRGYIGELVVFDGELTSTQRSSITTYLMTKWGIS